MIYTHPLSPLDTSWLENHSSNYPPLTTLTLKWIDCPGGRRFNNSRTTGRGGPQTTFTSYNIANAGTVHSPTHNLEILFSWGRTTWLHFTGLQRSSLMSIQAQTAGYEWSQSRPPKGHSNAQLQKFAPFRMLRMSYSCITIWGVPVCSCRGQICWISPFFAELIFFLFICFLFDFFDWLSLFVFTLMLIYIYYYVQLHLNLW